MVVHNRFNCLEPDDDLCHRLLVLVCDDTIYPNFYKSLFVTQKWESVVHKCFNYLEPDDDLCYRFLVLLCDGHQLWVLQELGLVRGGPGSVR